MLLNNTINILYLCAIFKKNYVGLQRKKFVKLSALAGALKQKVIMVGNYL